MSSASQPRGQFCARINEQDFLGVTISAGKKHSKAEVIVVQPGRRDGDNWETVGRLAVLGRLKERVLNFQNVGSP